MICKCMAANSVRKLITGASARRESDARKGCVGTQRRRRKKPRQSEVPQQSTLGRPDRAGRRLSRKFRPRCPTCHRHSEDVGRLALCHAQDVVVCNPPLDVPLALFCIQTHPVVSTWILQTGSLLSPRRCNGALPSLRALPARKFSGSPKSPLSKMAAPSGAVPRRALHESGVFSGTLRGRAMSMESSSIRAASLRWPPFAPPVSPEPQDTPACRSPATRAIFHCARGNCGNPGLGGVASPMLPAELAVDAARYVHYPLLLPMMWRSRIMRQSSNTGSSKSFGISHRNICGMAATGRNLTTES